MGIINILLADDMADIRRHFAELLDKETDMAVVGQAASGKEAVEKARELRPDVVLMDILMETSEAGLEAAEVIRRELPDTRVIILTIHEDDQLLFRAYCAGVMDYILKTDAPDVIVSAIRSVHKNQMMLRPSVAEKIVGEFARIRSHQDSLLYTFNIVSRLTNSEFDILCQVYQGRSYREISNLRFVSMATIKSQVNSILHKFRLNNMKEVIGLLKHMPFDEIMRNHAVFNN